MAFNYPYGDSQQLNLEWFLNKFKDLNDHYDDVATDLSAAQTAATTAIAAKDQAVISETSAASSAGAAMTNALRAEGFAVGEQVGTPVGSGSPYYQDNAKYFATQAATSATNAGTSETNAGNSATSAGNAKTAAETAALEAEGFAVGEQNGTPVSSGSPYYQDNSKYYATQAGNSASAASTSETNAHNSELAAAASALSADGAAAQAMIAPLEPTTTAAADHNTGEYFRLNGVLYIATADIEIGDTITVGTNCEQAVLGDEVSDLKNAVNQITNKSIKNIIPTLIDAYTNSGKLNYPRTDGKCIYFPIENGYTYDIHITGTFNRCAFYGCNEIAHEANVTLLYTYGPGTYTEKTYQHTADNTYKYLLVMLAFQYPQFSATYTVVETKGNQDTNFIINGIPVCTKEETKQLFTSTKYLRSYDDVSLIATSSGVFSLYDALVTNYPEYVSKNTLTKGTFTNYEYVFSTANYNTAGQRSRDNVIIKPVILLTSGVHGYERSAVMSTYSFFKDLCENIPPISKVLHSYTIRVIPIVCPWGYDHDTRWNENGVNINRNFNANWALNGTPFTDDYSGASAASELETQLVQDWLDTYLPNAAIFIDHHNSAFVNEVSYLNAVNTLTGTDTLKDSYRKNIADATGYWVRIRGMDDPTLIYEYTGNVCVDGGTQRYGTNMNKLSATLETSWNQNSSGMHSAITIGVGAEALSALIIGVVDELTE